MCVCVCVVYDKTINKRTLKDIEEHKCLVAPRAGYSQYTITGYRCHTVTALTPPPLPCYH